MKVGTQNIYCLKPFMFTGNNYLVVCTLKQCFHRQPVCFTCCACMELTNSDNFVLPAEIVVNPEVVTEVQVGSTIFLSCVASGHPLPSISWAQQSRELTNGSGFIIHQQLVTEAGISFMTSTLEACSTNASTYTCSAANQNNQDVFITTVELLAGGSYCRAAFMYC